MVCCLGNSCPGNGGNSEIELAGDSIDVMLMSCDRCVALLCLGSSCIAWRGMGTEEREDHVRARACAEGDSWR